MKTAKVIIGIISMVLFLIITFQSCAAGIGNAISENGESSGSVGFIVALFMLVAGIIGVAGKNSKGACVTAGIFYALAAIFGFNGAGSFSDLKIWGALSLVFAVVFIVSAKNLKRLNDTES